MYNLFKTIHHFYINKQVLNGRSNLLSQLNDHSQYSFESSKLVSGHTSLDFQFPMEILKLFLDHVT